MRMPSAAGISCAMHENPNSRCARLPGTTRHAFSTSPGAQPAAAITQSPARADALTVA